ncbi:hypothetical protein K431DRAFT_348068 [Polychaeton citri CBS 116435]|uniref:Uncharacterized protein n=1 Tax=Polychaeton citri CBS 116435 TaxID=1314669 RepID=A0A9P4UND2_9PEZI|nr:hypothetical protein K431DRAFT_348068 [Polychaeton citri CBS 116435]
MTHTMVRVQQYNRDTSQSLYKDIVRVSTSLKTIMDLTDELESMATSAKYEDKLDEDSASKDATTRWPSMFNNNGEEAQPQKISEIIDSPLVSAGFWTAIREEQDVLGCIREASSYWLSNMRYGNIIKRPATCKVDKNAQYLIELEGPLDSLEKVRQIIRSQSIPSTCHSRSEEDGSVAEFCILDGQER